MKRISIIAMALCILPTADSRAGGKTTVSLGDLKSDAPATWKTKKAPFNTRLFTFVVPQAEGDEREAEIQVIYFGKGSGGGLNENLGRWKKMFEPPMGKELDDIAKTEKFKVGDAEVTVLDMQGTYLDKFPPFAPNAKTIRRPDYRRVNVYVDTDDGPFFIIFVGPAKTVAQNKKDFDNWLKAFK